MGGPMRAMVLDQPRQQLRPAELERPSPLPGQVIIRVHACAVCRTDLHVVDGELPDPQPHLGPRHGTDDLVARHPMWVRVRELALHDMQVGGAYLAGMYPDDHLARAQRGALEL